MIMHPISVFKANLRLKISANHDNQRYLRSIPLLILNSVYQD